VDYLLAHEPFWHQSLIPNPKLSLSERINRKLEFSWGVLNARELPPSKLYFAAIFHKTNTTMVLRRSENFRIQNFMAKLQSRTHTHHCQKFVRHPCTVPVSVTPSTHYPPHVGCHITTESAPESLWK
jgi:hypothetical protein